MIVRRLVANLPDLSRWTLLHDERGYRRSWEDVRVQAKPFYRISVMVVLLSFIVPPPSDLYAPVVPPYLLGGPVSAAIQHPQACRDVLEVPLARPVRGVVCFSPAVLRALRGLFGPPRGINGASEQQQFPAFCLLFFASATNVWVVR